MAGGNESTTAAFARLEACLPPISARWNEEVAAVLRGGVHDPTAQGFEILSLAGAKRYDEAESLAGALPAPAWAAQLRLEVALARGRHSSLQLAAEQVLSFRPEQSSHLRAGIALARAGLLDRAGEVAAGVAHDLNTPPVIRADAFEALLKVRAQQDDWASASREWELWQRLSHRELDRLDARVSAWQVHVTHHARQS